MHRPFLSKTMKIAILSQVYPPMVSGAAIVAQRLAQGMAARQHSVLVLTASDTDYAYSIKRPGLTIERLPSLPNPLRRGQRFVPGSQNSALRLLADFAPDVLHMHDPFSLSIAGLEYARQENLPRVATIHALPGIVTAYEPALPGLRETTEDLIWWYAAWFLKQFTALVAPTHITAQRVAQHTHTPPLVISSGVDTHTFRPMAPNDLLRQSLGIPSAAPLILYVGRLDREKNVDLVIRAAAGVMALKPAHLLIVGDGTEYDNLVALSEQLGIMDRCHFSGFVKSTEKLADVYNLATVFVTACEVETQGMVLLEAAACGLPIVAVRSGGIPEVVQDKVGGWLTPPGDVEHFSQKLLDLIEHPDRARQMGQAGRKQAENHSI